ncbi:MAG: NUDIX hydrolase [bacterium]|jgi:8-oxo-dGTP pyrophosphatase MutT (NUDIX family)|nr:NUDIX hydrolase [Betaproteobacteria bacterium]
MSTEIWKPNVVVAAIAERDGRFLLIEEETSSGLRLNQPAGHWDPGETLLEAVARETLEESAYHFTPTALVGIYSLPLADSPITYLRFAFAGRITGHEPGRALDTGIVRALWQTPDEIRAGRDRHRSPLLLECVEDYLAGHRHPLDLIRHHP